MEPIEIKLKSHVQVAIARIQDLALESLLALDSKIILHGGTAIWRCYKGKRFSYDIDIYVSKSQREKIYKELTWELSKRNLSMNYNAMTENVISVFDNEAKVKLEMMINARIKSITKEYERADGSFMFVNTLTADALINEKIKAYDSRRYERDLYDIYHLVSTQEISKKTRNALISFINKMQPPIDKDSLSSIVYEGAVPNYNNLVDGIKRRLGISGSHKKRNGKKI